MKIGILTLPLNANYGGVLQAYALKTFLEQIGHEVWLINRVENNCFWKTLKRIVKNQINRVLLSKETAICQKDVYFFNKYLTPMTIPIDSERKMKNLVSKFDAFVVGSDQIWREEYYRDWKKNFFLDFTNNAPVKRVAFAASFGVGDWGYDEEMTKELTGLLVHFNGISVREKSGVELCEKRLKVNAQLVIDPTMLLTVSFYENICKSEHVSRNNGGLFIYMLGQGGVYDQIKRKVSLALENLEPYCIDFSTKGTPICGNKTNETSIAGWIQGFIDAEYVLTDSFHGCVFSILFNKPFLVLANVSGGLTRFESLLNIFGLEDRLVHSKIEITDQKIFAPINWSNVNGILDEQRIKAKLFLCNSLKD